MDNRKAARRFCELFRAVYLNFHERSAPTDYQPSRESLAVLQHLAGTGPLTVTEAAPHFSRSQSAMSEIVNRLEKRELLERIPDERDRRRTLVWLTPLGLSVWKRSSRVLSEDLLARALEKIEPETRTTLLKAMEELVGDARGGRQ